MVTATWQDHPVLVTAGDDRTVRVWDLATSEPLAIATLPAAASTLAARDHTIICGLGTDVVALELTEPEHQAGRP